MQLAGDRYPGAGEISAAEPDSTLQPLKIQKFPVGQTFDEKPQISKTGGKLPLLNYCWSSVVSIWTFKSKPIVRGT